MILDHRYAHLDRLRQALSVAVYPVRILVDVPYSTYDWLSQSLASRADLLEENRRLRRERLELSARLQRLDALREENESLRKLMQSARELDRETGVAELIQVDLDPYRHRIVINRGSRDGVCHGQPLLDASGIMGQVTSVGPLSAEAILLSDPGHGTPVEVNRNGLRTIALGTGDTGVLDLPYLANNADIRAGDLLVTSGLGGRYPRGYPVALVKDVVRRPGETFASVKAEPVAALNRAREVLLVWTLDPNSAGDPQCPPPQAH